jgi:hypothetical protein
LKNDVNVPSKSNKQKNLEKNISFYDENPEPDPNGSGYQNVTDPQHWYLGSSRYEYITSDAHIANRYIISKNAFLPVDITGTC